MPARALSTKKDYGEEFMTKRLGWLTLALLLLLTGCGTAKNSDKTDKKETAVASADAAKQEEKDKDNQTLAESEEQEAFDPWKDYTVEIKDAVSKAVASSESLSEEMEKIEKLQERYYDDPMMQEYSQAERNQIAQWLYVVWDTEINNLWSRMSDELDADTKEKVLTSQRIWIILKEAGLSEALSDYVDGSIYPMLQSQELGKTTRTRVYYMADIFAKFKGEEFEKPELPIVGRFVEPKDGKAERLLIIREGMEGGYLVMMSIDDVGSLTGTLVKENGKWIFENSAFGIRGEITVGWKGAAFKVKKTQGGVLKEGKTYRFSMIL